MYFVKQVLGIILISSLAFACSPSNSRGGVLGSSHGTGMQFMKGKQIGGKKRMKARSIGHMQKKKHRKMKRNRRR